MENVGRIHGVAYQSNEKHNFRENGNNLVDLVHLQGNMSSNNINIKLRAENRTKVTKTSSLKNRTYSKVNIPRHREKNINTFKKYIQRKRYAYNNLNEKEIKIIKSNFCAACDEIQKYVRNMLINKKQYILEEEDFKYFSDKENQILIFKINKIRRKAFVSTKYIYAIWRSKVSDIFNKAPLIISFKYMINNNNRRVKPRKGFNLKNLLILEFIAQHHFLEKMKNHDFGDLFFVDFKIISSISYIRLCFENIVLISQFPKP
ncbi:hypothetical protein CWI36_2240p0010 [Hamiltosporidium magnivora]|uniref:Uncharacterized protein n=1 Tax=Hamiltosporidium magnivora TaxID=148818 RepID=A0A4Q9KV84_9MICR|nr:hypothetical protein CWI36_2240p0010 [Hamiltosporidium magnivora]